MTHPAAPWVAVGAGVWLAIGAWHVIDHVEDLQHLPPVDGVSRRYVRGLVVGLLMLPSGPLAPLVRRRLWLRA